MEESLEQERLKLEEVLKTEIKALNRVFNTLIPPRSQTSPVLDLLFSNSSLSPGAFLRSRHGGELGAGAPQPWGCAEDGDQGL